MKHQGTGLRSPVHLNGAGKMRHWIRLDTCCGDSELLALHQGGSGPAEGIQYALPNPQPELVDVVPHKVGREREHKPIPVMGRFVRRPYPVVSLCRKSLRFANPKVKLVTPRHADSSHEESPFQPTGDALWNSFGVRFENPVRPTESPVGSATRRDPGDARVHHPFGCSASIAPPGKRGSGGFRLHPANGSARRRSLRRPGSRSS